MKARGARHLAAIGIAAITPLLFSGVAAAGDGPTHDGPPRSWGPQLEALCAAGPAAAAAEGYFVIVGNAAGNVIDGTPDADAIFSGAGNDTVRGLGGPDLLCLGLGNDRGRGNQGNDAVFGDEHNDKVVGDMGRDYLNGRDQNDTCDGGPDADAADECEVLVSVP